MITRLSKKWAEIAHAASPTRHTTTRYALECNAGASLPVGVMTMFRFAFDSSRCSRPAQSAALATSVAPSMAAETGKPNVVVILSDDFGWGAPDAMVRIRVSCGRRASIALAKEGGGLSTEIQRRRFVHRRVTRS